MPPKRNEEKGHGPSYWDTPLTTLKFTPELTTIPQAENFRLPSPTRFSGGKGSRCEKKPSGGSFFGGQMSHVESITPQVARLPTCARFQDSYNTPLEHTPGNPPTQL